MAAHPANNPSRPDVLLTLNGFRGVAAISVMVFHRKEWFGSSFILPNAWMAVDFFFILSGFVIALAYRRRLEGDMSAANFLWRRVQRLYPLIAVSLIFAIGLVVGKAHLSHRGPPGDLLDRAAAAFLVFPAFWRSNCWSLNAPMWSLFYEWAINIGFAFAITHLKGPRLAVFVALSAVALLVISPRLYSLPPDVPASLWLGFPRVIFYFSLGVLLERIKAPWLRIGLWPGSFLLLLSFMIQMTWPFALPLVLACTMILYPIIIVGGANAEPSSRWNATFARIAGDLSYPIYVLHVPAFGLVAGLSLALGASEQPTTVVEVILRLVAVLVISGLALKLYDEPVRKWLGGLSRPRAVQPA